MLLDSDFVPSSSKGSLLNGLAGDPLTLIGIINLSLRQEPSLTIR